MAKTLACMHCLKIARAIGMRDFEFAHKEICKNREHVRWSEENWAWAILDLIEKSVDTECLDSLMRLAEVSSNSEKGLKMAKIVSSVSHFFKEMSVSGYGYYRNKSSLLLEAEREQFHSSEEFISAVSSRR